MRSSHSLDRIGVAFDDDHPVADACLLLPATPAAKLGLPELVRRPHALAAPAVPATPDPTPRILAIAAPTAGAGPASPRPPPSSSCG